MNCVIAGARERIDDKDKSIVEKLIAELVRRYGPRRTNIISVGCDKGVGKFARDFCMEKKIIFVECRMKLEGEDIPRSFFKHVFQARNDSLLVLGDEFYIFKGPYESGIIEAMIKPARQKVTEKRVIVYEYEKP